MDKVIHKVIYKLAYVKWRGQIIKVSVPVTTSDRVELVEWRIYESSTIKLY